MTFIRREALHVAVWSTIFGIGVLFKLFPAALVVSGILSASTGLAIFLRVKGGQSFTNLPEPNYPAVYEFKDLKDEDMTALYLNWVQGVTFINFVYMLFQNWKYIDWRRYYLRISALLGMSLLNSCFYVVEEAVYGKDLDNQKLNEKPVFILGHPRSGTTMVHNLLGENKKDFIYASTFQCGFYTGCLILEQFKWLFAGAIDEKRPMDNMPLSFDTPQEDELCLASFSGGASPYMPLVFMENEPEFRQFFSFEHESKFVDDRVKDPKEIFDYKFGNWKSSFYWFMKKVTFAKNKNADKQMVLKSPVHTARGKLFLKMFPEGQFIYIHREPYRVFQSAANMAEKTYVHSYLTKHSNQRIQDFILEQYVVLFKEYLEAKKVIPEKNLFEVSYDEITEDVVGTMKKMYDKFGWTNWEEMKPKYQKYADESKSFKRNSLVQMDPALKQVIYDKWKEAFEYFGYQK